MKLHKIYTSVFCMIIFSLLMSSCNSFLEEEPENKKSADQHWKTEADAKSGVNALYFGGVPYLNNIDVDGGWTPKGTMWGGIMSGLFVDKRKDRTFTSACENANFNIEAFNSTADKLWNEFYKGSSRSNFVIANIPKMTGVLSEDQIKNYLAQAKFFRAYSYFYLAKEFGNVPYIDFPYLSLENIYKEPTPAAEVYKKVEQDLLEAIDGLPNKAFYDNGCYVTKPIAQTLLAQVYLQWAGAPLNGGNEYYAKAAAMAEEVIKGGVHALAQDIYDKDGNLTESAFNIIKTTKSHNEIIFAKEYNKTTLDIGNSYYHRAIESDVMQWEGKPFAAAGLYNAYLPCDMLIDSYDPADTRGHEKQFFFRKYTYINKANGDTINKTLGNVGNWMWFDEKATIEGRDGDYNVPTMRFSEVLLIAAEGLARTGKEAEAKIYLNQVRKRAGLGDETATGNALILSILTERFHEFPLEFKVWDDIRRTHLYPEADGMKSGKLKWTPLKTATIQNKPERATKVGAIPEHALLWPIPLGEMQANPSLQGHQNPGWE